MDNVQFYAAAGLAILYVPRNRDLRVVRANAKFVTNLFQNHVQWNSYID